MRVQIIIPKSGGMRYAFHFSILFSVTLASSFPFAFVYLVMQLLLRRELSLGTEAHAAT